MNIKSQEEQVKVPDQTLQAMVGKTAEYHSEATIRPKMQGVMKKEKEDRREAGFCMLR